MKKNPFAIAALAALASTPALAADIPVKAPPTVYSWTGFYVGATAGGAWGTFDPTTSTVFVPPGFVGGVSYFQAVSVPQVNATGAQHASSSAFTGGIEGGYNWQTGSVVLGFESDFQSFGLKGTASGTTVYACCAPNSFTITSSVKTNWLFTARPRVGIANNNWLVYATGGLAATNLGGNFSFTDTFPDVETASLSSTKLGYTVGGGVEKGLWDRWTVKAEYLYVNLGSVSTTAQLPGYSATFFTHSTDLKANIARLGINYKLAGP